MVNFELHQSLDLPMATETPLFYSNGIEPLFGVLTQPVVSPRNVGVLLLQGAVYVLSTNRNRMAVRMARALSERGYPSLRIDYSGVGESDGVIGDHDLTSPSLNDVVGAVLRLHEAGCERIAIVGACYGARAGLQTALEERSIAGLFLIAPPVGDRGRGRAESADDLGELFEAGLREMYRRGTPTHLVYGRFDDYFPDFQGALSSRLRHIFATSTPICYSVQDGRVHGFSTIATQDAVVAAMLDWISAQGDFCPPARTEASC